MLVQKSCTEKKQESTYVKNTSYKRPQVQQEESGSRQRHLQHLGNKALTVSCIKT